MEAASQRQHRFLQSAKVFPLHAASPVASIHEGSCKVLAPSP